MRARRDHVLVRLPLLILIAAPFSPRLSRHNQYQRISAPVTLIYGDSDWSRPNERERTRALLPNARMFTLKDTGHFSAVENPSELARIILGS